MICVLKCVRTLWHRCTPPHSLFSLCVLIACQSSLTSILCYSVWGQKEKKAESWMTQRKKAYEGIWCDENVWNINIYQKENTISLIKNGAFFWSFHVTKKIQFWFISLKDVFPEAQWFYICVVDTLFFHLLFSVDSVNSTLAPNCKDGLIWHWWAIFFRLCHTFERNLLNQIWEHGKWCILV